MRTGVPWTGALLLAALVWGVGAEAAAATGQMRPYQRLIESVAARHGLEPEVFGALVDVESARRADAVSEDGAQGLAQLMPATAARFKVVDPHNPEDNLDGAARYFSWLLDRFDGDLVLALAAYNAGEAAVDRHGGVPPYRETRGFVAKVLRRADRPVPELAGSTGAPRPRPDAAPRPIRLVTGPDGTPLLTNLPEKSR
jgi:soluble lytic murein transglycosylase-like protein